VHEELRIVIGEVTDAVFDADGTIIDYAGDGVFAVWGVPFPQSDQAALAARCAVSINQRLRRRSFRALGGKGTLYGIGIASGEVLVGAVGSTLVAKYGVVGPSVPVAQRLAALHMPGLGDGAVYMTAPVVRELGGSGIAVRALGPMRLPGLEGAVEVFQCSLPDGAGTAQSPHHQPLSERR
jgi:class 3 adenylate cyclase